MSVLICPTCNAYGPGNSDMTNDELIAAWNTCADTEYGGIPATDENMAKYGWMRKRTCRLELVPNSDRLWWCSNCHSYHEHVSNYPWEYCPRCGANVQIK